MQSVSHPGGRHFERIDPRGDVTVLDRIVAQRRTHLDRLRTEFGALDPAALAPSTRSLYTSLGAGRRGLHRFIMECKSASPSLGMIRPDYHPGTIARIYSQWAGGISVLTEPDFFGGSLTDLATVASATHLPVLCKDFIVDTIQVIAARARGADAILLMLSVLDDSTYRELAGVAGELGLDILTEVSNRAELDRALALDARIIGINNRNLRDLSIDTDRTLELAQLIPTDRVVLSESGIRDIQTVRRLGPVVSGFLVGSQLTSQPDIATACRRLLFGDTKVCGLSEAGAARVAYAAGATYGGLITAPHSPRFVDPVQAGVVAEAEPGLRWVLVVTAAQVDEIVATWRRYQATVKDIYALQLHCERQADEAAFLSAVGAALAAESGGCGARSSAGVRLWRALNMSQAEAGDVGLAATHPDVDFVVCDAGPGGTGTVFDWNRISPAIRQRVILAGGIGPANAAAALDFGVAGLDFNSRLESTPGVKDPGAIMAAFKALRGVRAAAVDAHRDPAN